MPADTSSDGNDNCLVPVGESGKLSGLVLGFPLDQLLNRKCPLWPIRGQEGEEDRNSNRGIQLPHLDKDREFEDCNPGSGNIVICGTPGTGKSTLALQIARACTRSENRATSAYFALENRPSDIVRKANEFGWNTVSTLCHMHCAPSTAADGDLASILRHALTQPPVCPILNGESPFTTDSHDHKEGIASRVLVCTLSPRPLGKKEDSSDVFWHRYRELERFLSAAHQLRADIKKGKNDPLNRHIFPLVVVDSLNMMTLRHPARDEMFALFSLFRNYETIGVFTVEATADTPFDSTLADVVIRLTADDDQGYFIRLLEVEKSRFVNQVNGKHPFKTTPKPKEETPKNKVLTPPIHWNGKIDGEGDPPRRGVVIFPSLHYVVLRTGVTPVRSLENKVIDEWGRKPGNARWGITAFDSVLPHNLVPGSVVAISGPRGTFKSNLAMTFLAKGLACGETGVLIRLHDQPMIPPIPADHATATAKDSWLESLPAVSKEVIDGENGFGWEKLKPLAKNESDQWDALVDRQKAVIKVWTFNDKANARLFEIDFKTGAVLAEEFVHIVREIVMRATKFSGGKGVTRMVLDDVSEIASGYPFLLNSKTSGNLFLPAMAHIMRNEKIDLVVTGTTGELKEADEVVGRICAVADAVVSCKFVDVFGQRYVAVDSEGLVGRQGTEGEASKDVRSGVGSAIPVIMHGWRIQNEPRTFEVSAKPLEGLVGFDTGHVYRPGVTIHAFQENEGVHKRYNDEVAAMVEGLFSKQPPSRRTDRPEDAHRYARGDVSLIPFDSDKSEALHDSLGLAQGKPLDRTVLYTVDEFWAKIASTEDPRSVFDILSNSKSAGTSERDGDDSLYLGENQMPDRVRRYYSNVLLLAYRRDVTLKNQEPWYENGATKPADASRFGDECEYSKAKSWADVFRAANEIRGEARASSKGTKIAKRPAKPEIRRAFWHDHSATETLSCALLDAWLGGECLSLDVPINTLAAELDKKLANEGEINNITALAKLLHLTDEVSENAPSIRGAKHDTDSEAREEVFGRHDKEVLLPNDAAVYLCWYSQLRDLLDRNPELASKIGVCALPGGGFRGDWYVGVAQGSVSVTLGKQILRSLCDKKEGYKRFAEGVGLPPLLEFYKKDQHIPAWPGAKEETLREVGLIHAAASSRARFPNYATYRSAISAICSQLTQPFGLIKDKEAEIAKIAVKSVVGGLPARIRMLERRGEHEG